MGWRNHGCAQRLTPVRVAFPCRERRKRIRHSLGPHRALNRSRRTPGRRRCTLSRGRSGGRAETGAQMARCLATWPQSLCACSRYSPGLGRGGSSGVLCQGYGARAGGRDTRGPLPARRRHGVAACRAAVSVTERHPLAQTAEGVEVPARVSACPATPSTCD